MIKVVDSNRDQLIDLYCTKLLDDMDHETLYQFAYDMLFDSKDLMDNKPLENEIKEYYPQLLETINDG